MSPTHRTAAIVFSVICIAVLGTVLVAQNNQLALNPTVTNNQLPTLKDFLASDPRFALPVEIAETPTQQTFILSIKRPTVSNYWQTHTLAQPYNFQQLQQSSPKASLGKSELFAWENEQGKFINDSKVVTADILVAEGTVHIVESEIIPGSFPDLFKITTQDSRLETYSQLLSQAGLAGLLANPNAQLTLLVPPETLLKQVPSEQLSKTLRRHIVGTFLDKSQLTHSLGIENLWGETLDFTVTPINIVSTRRANNGVIYFLDNLL